MCAIIDLRRRYGDTRQRYATEVQIMNLMNQAFCQCCGMPMTDELHGTNAGGGRNEDYCNYCLDRKSVV